VTGHIDSMALATNAEKNPWPLCPTFPTPLGSHLNRKRSTKQHCSTRSRSTTQDSLEDCHSPEELKEIGYQN
jgi:hypothetical protein